MKLFLATLALVALCVFGLGFNIIFRKKEFPKYDVGSNEEMQKRGIRCYKDVDAEIHNKACRGDFSEACKDCGLKPAPEASKKVNL